MLRADALSFCSAITYLQYLRRIASTSCGSVKQARYCGSYSGHQMSSPNSEECLKDSSIKSCGKGLKNRGTAPNARSECREKSVSEILNAASWSCSMNRDGRMTIVLSSFPK